MGRVSKIWFRIFKGITFSCNPSGDVLFLTFDDGPDPVSTPVILKALKNFNAKATFFVTGMKAEKQQALIRNIKEEGHSIGNHSYSHIEGVFSSKKKYLKDVSRCREIVDSELYRPPYGRIRPGLARALLKEGYKIILWSVNTYDFRCSNPKKRKKTRIPNGIKSGDILLLHDKPETVENTVIILNNILDHFSKKGIKFEEIP